MSYAILVRTFRDPHDQQVLAYDIADRGEAARLASGLAGSYASHGTLAGGDAYWFHDREGLHELRIETV